MLLKDWIDREGLTLERAGMRLGLTKQAVARYVDPDQKVTPKLEIAICIHLMTDGEVSFMDLLPPIRRRRLPPNAYFNIVELDTNIDLS